MKKYSHFHIFHIPYPYTVPVPVLLYIHVPFLSNFNLDYTHTLLYLCRSGRVISHYIPYIPCYTILIITYITLVLPYDYMIYENTIYYICIYEYSHYILIYIYIYIYIILYTSASARLYTGTYSKLKYSYDYCYLP